MAKVKVLGMLCVLLLITVWYMAGWQDGYKAGLEDGQRGRRAREIAMEERPW